MEKLADQSPVYVSRMTADKCRLQLGFRSFYRAGLSPITEQTKRRVCLFANLFFRVSSFEACNLTCVEHVEHVDPHRSVITPAIINFISIGLISFRIEFVRTVGETNLSLYLIKPEA